MKYMLLASLIIGICLYVAGLVLLGMMHLEAGAYSLAVASILLIITVFVWLCRRWLRKIREKGGPDAQPKRKRAIAVITGIVLYFAGLVLFALNFQDLGVCVSLIGICTHIGIFVAWVIHKIKH